MKVVVQISDTHISPTKRHFAGNWPALTAWIAAKKPDLIIHTGDVTVDGADVEEDFDHCAGLIKALGVPVLSVPGNHDVGEAHHPHQPVNDERMERWRRHLGRDYWARDVENWRLIGLNSMLFGADSAAEMEQYAWLEKQMEQAAGRRLGWFIHRPLFIEAPDEGDKGYWSVPPSQRARLFDLVRKYEVALIASGHLHRLNDFTLDGTRYIWAPSSGFVVGPEMQPGMAGDSELGAVRYTFDGREYTAEIENVEGLEKLWIDDVIHEVYPPHT